MGTLSPQGRIVIRVSGARGSTGPKGDKGNPGSGGGTSEDVMLSSYRSAATTTDHDSQIWMAAAIDSVAQGKWLFIDENPERANGEWWVGVDDQNADASIAGNIPDGLRVRGIKGKSFIRHYSDAGNGGFTHCLSCDPVGTGTVESPNVQSDKFNNLVFRDFTLLGNVVDEGFAEFQYLLNLNAVTGVTVDNIDFIGQKSDGIYLGASNIGGGSQNRHNKNIRITNCLFDGINLNNRNGISALDYDGLYIGQCKFRNLTREGDGLSNVNPPFDRTKGVRQPGPIDIEPNPFTPDSVCNNIVVEDCDFYNCGGAAINLLLGSPNDINPKAGFYFRNLTVDNVRLGLSQGFGANNITPGYDALFDGCTVRNCWRPFEYTTFIGVTFANTSFYKCELPGVIGYVGGQMVRYATLSNVLFDTCGTLGGVALELRGMDQFTFDNVKFRNCNTRAIAMRGGNEFKNSSFNSVDFINDAGATYQIVYGIDATISDSDGNPIMYPSTITVDNFNTANLPLLGFFAKGSEVRTPPASGKFRYGARLKASMDAEPGAAAGWWNGNDSTTSGNPSWIPDGVIPGAPADPAYVTGSFSYFYNMTYTPYSGGVSGGNRLNSTGPLAYASSNVARLGSQGNNGLTIEVTAPATNAPNSFVGMTVSNVDGAANANAILKKAGVKFAGGVLQNVVDNGDYDSPYSSYKYGDRFRIFFMYDPSPGGTKMRVQKYNRTNGQWEYIQANGPSGPRDPNLPVQNAMYAIVTMDQAYASLQVPSIS